MTVSLVLTLSGCILTPSRTTDRPSLPPDRAAPSPATDSSPARRVVNESLIGSWHADSVVGSGYSERYSFFQDGTFLFIPSEYADSSKTDRAASVGTWSLVGNNLILNTTSALDAKFEKVVLRSQSTISLGDFEQTESNIAYSVRRLFDKQYFWKFEDDPLFWCPPDTVYWRESRDRDFEVCDQLLNAYGPLQK